MPAPCWKLLLVDWENPPIGRVYPLPCYHEAIAHLHTDLAIYTSARDDILRALQRRIVDPRPVRATAKSDAGAGLPLPLLLLAALSLMLLAASVGATAWRRLQARRGR